MTPIHPETTALLEHYKLEIQSPNFKGRQLGHILKEVRNLTDQQIRVAMCAIGILRHPETEGVLLLRKGASDPYYPGRWSFPGGKVEKNERLREAAIREFYEETQITVEMVGDRPKAHMVHPKKGIIFVVHSFEVSPTTGNITPTLSPEHDAWEYVPLDQCDRFLPPVVAQFLR